MHCWLQYFNTSSRAKNRILSYIQAEFSHSLQLLTLYSFQCVPAICVSVFVFGWYQFLLLQFLHEQRRVHDFCFFKHNCCHIRKKIKNIFGGEVCVCLDLFHASQRICRKLSRFHPLYHDCVRDLKLPFRDPTDTGEERKLSTPSPAQLTANVDRFMTKWSNMECDGLKIINDNVHKEIISLRLHMHGKDQGRHILLPQIYS